jgi:hypothetical protein
VAKREQESDADSELGLTDSTLRVVVVEEARLDRVIEGGE